MRSPRRSPCPVRRAAPPPARCARNASDWRSAAHRIRRQRRTCPHPPSASRWVPPSPAVRQRGFARRSSSPSAAPRERVAASASSRTGEGPPATGSGLAGGGGDFGLDQVEQFRRLAVLDAGDIVLIFEQYVERVVDHLGRE